MNSVREKIAPKYFSVIATIAVLLAVFLVPITSGYAFTTLDQKSNTVYLTNDDELLNIPFRQALQIGTKIWYNECGGTVSGLTSWNHGEKFASVGIGHFTWYPNYGRAHTGTGTFPELIDYIKDHDPNAKVPSWLLKNGEVAACPWNSRYQFATARYSSRMRQLRSFLSDTIPWQAAYMVDRLKDYFPTILERAPKNQRLFIYHKFHNLLQTSNGTYALVDYLNFKGPGASKYDKYKHSDWGLLQVMEKMHDAPKEFNDLTAFVWAARQVLIHRVYHANPKRHEERWLVGWLNRVNKYLR